MPCGFLDLLSHIIIAVQVENVGHKVESVLVVLNIGIEPRQIEPVCEVILINLAKVFIPSRRDKLYILPLASVLRNFPCKTIEGKYAYNKYYDIKDKPRFVPSTPRSPIQIGVIAYTYKGPELLRPRVSRRVGFAAKLESLSHGARMFPLSVCPELKKAQFRGGFGIHVFCPYACVSNSVDLG